MKLKVERNGETLELEYNGKGHAREIEKSGGKFFEIHMLDAISKLPYRRGLCLDIGANVGNHTVFFSRFCNFDEVWAYEPDPDSFKILKRNVGAHCKRTVRLFNIAIGDKKGTVSLIRDPDEPPVNRILKDSGDIPIRPIRTTVKVALMKIDVEGYEKKVIAGAFDVIKRDKPEIFCETHGDPAEILKLLPERYTLRKRYNNSPTYHYSYDPLHKPISV